MFVGFCGAINNLFGGLDKFSSIDDISNIETKND